MEVAGHVGEREFGVAEDLNLGRLPVLAHADGARVRDGVLRHRPRRQLGADHADEAVAGGGVQSHVLPDQHADADACAAGNGDARDAIG